MDPEERKFKVLRFTLCVKQSIRALTERQTQLQKAELSKKLASETIDITLPGPWSAMGSIHPVTQVQERICQFFTKAGFQLRQVQKLKMIITTLKP